MVKKINKTNLSKKMKKFDEKLDVIIKDFEGEELSFKIYKKFSPTKINEFLYEFLNDYDIISKGQNGREQLNAVFTNYLFIVMIKYFTDIDVPNDVDEKIKMLEVLTDLEILIEIIDSFDRDEYDKLMTKVTEVQEQISQGVYEFAAEMQKIEDEIENESIKDWIENGDQSEVKEDGV